MTNSKTRIKVFGRLAFVTVNKPERYKGAGAPRYSVSIIMDEENTAIVKAAMVAAAKEEWGDKASKMLKDLSRTEKTCLINGNDKSDYAGYEGHYVVKANAKYTAPPSLYQSRGGKNVRLDNESQTVFYSGCWANALIEIYAQNNQFGPRVNAALAGLQFVRDDVRFGGSAPADEDEFEVIEDADEPDFDDNGSDSDSDSDDDIPF